MKAVLIAASISLGAALFGTPMFIRYLVRQGYGQFIRDDGPTSHHTKRGTPTMGGAVIVAAALLAYAVAHLDDYIKISKQRSLGLRSGQKLLGQTLVAVLFAILALNFPNSSLRTPALTQVSFVRDTGLNLAFAGPVVGFILFIIWANLIIAGTSNGVNLTDGLDGLATGASVMVFAAYVLIGIWQFNQNCQWNPSSKCYEVRDPHDVAIVAACVMGACFGFLWWNAAPAKIFMGDTGSLSLGGALAGLAIVSRTELLIVILGGLFVAITLSVIIQVASFKTTGKRVFRMAPLQHHFELLGWQEVTIVIRFWIICGLFVAFGLGLFYAEWMVGA